jgi:acyl-coenzyme A synthetase/AMP-(fatty) acid ligase
VCHCAEALPQTTLHNLYGTSEAWDICCDMTGATEYTPDPVPVGQPLDHVTVAVLDTNGRPVPFGVPGEAYIGGAAPCLGFANRADQDQTRFCTIKTATGPLRLLSSGDRARARADGAIEILGRMDDQLKINGMRVHPAEVEAALNSIPGVTAAAVAGVPGPDKALRLWAWVIGDKGEDTVRTAVAQTLPSHMVPDRILLTDAMPQTPSGKVDRAALLAEAANAPAAIPMANERPVTDLERQIADIFAQVLGREVAVEQNFFAAGGHSLLAARALARINDQLALDLGIRDVFLAPSATGLAARAEAAPDTPRRTKIKRLPRAARPA